MSKLRCSITTSLDGYVAGPNQGVDNPLGEGGINLHDWAPTAALNGYFRRGAGVCRKD